ncbi:MULTISPECIES: hypothetical protein [unclassified Wolbachia]|uniref:hypothetical protein n=1 Tax=unclassified Wolbachia TaxID=2640676 RepID=UPI001CDC9354|nr:MULTISPECIES: hypothetical protein [unclassified Wolbachia]
MASKPQGMLMEVQVKENGESECHFVTKWIEFVTLIRVNEQTSVCSLVTRNFVNHLR